MSVILSEGVILSEAKDLSAHALLIALATWLVGWWTVPLVAAAWMVLRPRARGHVWRAALAGALGWTLLLALATVRGPTVELARRASGAMQVPPWTILALTLVLPALLAGSAAALVAPRRARR